MNIEIDATGTIMTSELRNQIRRSLEAVTTQRGLEAEAASVKLHQVPAGRGRRRFTAAALLRMNNIQIYATAHASKNLHAAVRRLEHKLERQAKRIKVKRGRRRRWTSVQRALRPGTDGGRTLAA